MRCSSRAVLTATATATAALAGAACGGDNDGPADPVGVVQIVSMILSSHAVDCGFIAPQTSAPDTILMQVHMVNTTDITDSVVFAASAGTVIRSSDPATVGTAGGVYPSLPFTPKPAVLGARTGEMHLRVSFPTAGLCRTKPSLYVGDEDVSVSARIRMTNGEYVTIPATIVVVWRPA